MDKIEFESLMEELEIEPRFSIDDTIKVVEYGKYTEYDNGKSNVYIVKGVTLVHIGAEGYASVCGKIPLSVLDEIRKRDPSNWHGIWCNALEKRIFYKPTYETYATHNEIIEFRTKQKLQDEDYIHDTQKYKKARKRIAEMRKRLLDEDYDNMFIERLIIHEETGIRDFVQTLKEHKTQKSMILKMQE